MFGGPILLALRGIFAAVPRSVIFGAVGLVAGVAALWGVYAYGKHEGRQRAALDAAEAIAKQYKDRSHENAAVDDLDAYGLCLELGGLPADCRAGLRGVGADPAPAADGGLSDRK